MRKPVRWASPSIAEVGGERLGALPVGRPRRSYLWRSAGGKHSSSSRPAISLANGSPAAIAASTQPSGRVRLNASISALVQRDIAAVGEHSTIRNCDAASAALISPPRSPAAARSCSSRKIGVRRLGTTPLAVSCPGKRARHAEVLELAVQPVGECLVLVAVAEERDNSGCWSRGTRRAVAPAVSAARSIAGNWASLAIDRPQRVPLTLLTQQDRLARIRRSSFAARPRALICAATHVSIRPWRDIDRRKSRQIMVGSVPVGGDAPISVQTMTNTPTEDAKATIDQIRRCEEAGADIIRVSCPTPRAPRR